MHQEVKPMTGAERQAAYRARKRAAALQEVRGVYAPPSIHQQIKAQVRRIIEKATRVTQE